jgi:nucleotide-binding universal stress UspA family protein
MKMETMLKLQAIASANQRATGVETGYTTSTGTIFEQIGQAADILNSAFVVMGTHGITGMQKIVGSYALKVITKSHTPYIVVQKNPVHATYQNIVVPIDYEPESKQPIFHIMNIAKLFNATCHIIYKVNKDDHINNKILNNVAYVENFLTENSIKYETVCLEKSSSSFSDEFLDYADNIKADLITLITEQNLTLVEFFMRPTEQYIIANKQKIPVMCIHPDYNALKYGSVFAS